MHVKLPTPARCKRTAALLCNCTHALRTASSCLHAQRRRRSAASSSSCGLCMCILPPLASSLMRRNFHIIRTHTHAYNVYLSTASVHTRTQNMWNMRQPRTNMLVRLLLHALKVSMPNMLQCSASNDVVVGGVPASTAHRVFFAALEPDYANSINMRRRAKTLARPQLRRAHVRAFAFINMCE